MDTRSSPSVDQNLSSAQHILWPVVESHLPIDITPHHAELLQSHFCESSSRKFPSDRAINVEFLVAPRSNISQKNIVPLRLVCTSAAAVTDALHTINLVASCVMMLVHSDPDLEEPSVTDSLILSICRHFSLTPSFATSLEGHPGFHQHVLQLNKQVGSMTNEFGPRDFCYAVAFPWSAKSTKHVFKQKDLFTVSSYTRISQDGVPELTMFLNVTPSFGESLKSTWIHGLTRVLESHSPSLYHHFSLFSIALYELQRKLGSLEMLHGYYGDARFELHLQSAEADTTTFFTQSRKFLGELRFMALSLDNLEQVIKALDRMARTGGAFPQDSTTRYLEEQRSLWAESLLRDFAVIRSRIVDMIARQRTTEEMISSVTALRDSHTLSHNTEEMTFMARATEKSGVQVAAMTRRMENDARLMRFLAEITAFFLPITAVATVFSMDFFSITGIPNGQIPTLENLKYSWIYFAFATPISLGVFIWWAYKRYDIIAQNGAEETLVEDNEVAEANVIMQRSTERSRLKQVAQNKLEEADAEMTKLEANPPPERDKEAKRDWEKKHSEAFKVLLFARRAIETGEDVEAMLRNPPDGFEG